MFDEITQDVNHSNFYNIRAEAVVAELIENGIELKDLLVIHKGNFKRQYSRDLAYLETFMLEKNAEGLGIYLNRDGLYDILPEGLFHDKTGLEAGQSKKLSGDSVILKQEEKSVRKFFLPFENEIFLQRVILELEERKILGRFSESIFNNLYPNLWKLHKSINREYINRMILMLHISHKIVGNYELTALCLQNILEEKVVARLCRESEYNGRNLAHNESNSENILGASSLGVNFVCGDLNDHFANSIEFIIGPLRTTKAEDYLPDASVTRFLDCFYGYFVPAEMNIKTTIEVADEELNFTLKQKGEGSVLGYETAINSNR